LGQPVITENRSSGVIPGQIVSQAAPDGYTLLVYSSTLWIGPLMQQAPYDAVKDFAPITLATRAPNLLLVYPGVAANSVKELIALAKAKPGALNYASGGTGSSAHLAGELFKALAGVNLVQIPYKSNGAAINDLIGGQVQVMFATAGSAGPNVKSGKLRALAVTGLQPSPIMPGLPTVAASGVPGYEAESVTVVLAPAKTPATLVSRLNQEIVRVLNRADVKERFFNLGLETVGSTPAQLSATMKSEIARLGKVIKEAGIHEQ
jgi:tripartite-type tricarboxylate transporter receptor subunit TctC